MHRSEAARAPGSAVRLVHLLRVSGLHGSRGLGAARSVYLFRASGPVRRKLPAALSVQGPIPMALYDSVKKVLGKPLHSCVFSISIVIFIGLTLILWRHISGSTPQIFCD